MKKGSLAIISFVESEMGLYLGEECRSVRTQALEKKRVLPISLLVQQHRVHLLVALLTGDLKNRLMKKGVQ